MVVPLLRILTVLYRKHSYCLTPVRESSTERPVIFMKQQEIIFWTDPLLYKVKGKFQGWKSVHCFHFMCVLYFVSGILYFGRIIPILQLNISEKKKVTEKYWTIVYRTILCVFFFLFFFWLITPADHDEEENMWKGGIIDGFTNLPILWTQPRSDRRRLRSPRNLDLRAPTLDPIFEDVHITLGSKPNSI